MSTEIEQCLFKQGGTYAVVELVLTEKRVAVSVASWNDLLSVVAAVFPDAKITSVDVYADRPDDLNLPWDIIGFDSYPLAEGRWRFVLHCNGIEYAFESRWPEVIPKS